MPSRLAARALVLAQTHPAAWMRLGPTAPGYQLPDTFWQPLDGDLVTAFAGGEMAQAE